MNAMKNKIKSQKGASITFALLLFLVCAVISSVVIVAATAAAGRMSEQADMDERYYAVTATAKRLNDMFDGKEVVVEYPVQDGKPDIDNATAECEDGNISQTLRKASIDVVQAILLKDKASVVEPDIPPIPDDESKVTCTIAREMKEDGRLEFTISAQKTANASNSGKYTVILSFSPNLPSSATKLSTNREKVVVKWKLLGAKKERATPKRTGG